MPTFFEPVDLYPSKAEPFEPFYLVANSLLAGTTITATWTAVAKNVDDTYRGRIELPIAAEVPTAVFLQAGVPEA
jgi:hypothetical protein